MTKDVRSDGWTGRTSGEPDGSPARSGSNLNWRHFAYMVVFWFAAVAGTYAGYRLEINILFLALVILWLSAGLLRHMRVLWRHHAIGDRQPNIGAEWAATSILVTGILFLLVVIEREMTNASP